MQHAATATVQVASTAALPVADCFPYWADVVTQTLVPLECDTPVQRDFFGSIRHRMIGRISIADVCGSAQRVRRTRAKIAHSPSDDLIVVVHVEGRCNAGRREKVARLQLKKLNARATQAKMDLHDLSEDLPTNWQRIPEVAKIAYDAHVALMNARKTLKEAEAA